MTSLSMTGFGKAEIKDTTFQVEVEIKSVNHRFKEIRVKSPSILNEIELKLKNKLSDKFKRGSFDVFVRTKKESTINHFDTIDDYKISDYLRKIVPLLDEKNFKYNVNPTDFLRPEFMKEKDEQETKVLFDLVLKAFDEALENLKVSRMEEGTKLVEVIARHKQKYVENFTLVEEKVDLLKEELESKLRKKFAEYKDEVQVEESRFLQEIIYYMEKYDIHEEINRIKIHLQKLDKLLKTEGEVGRQMDFLVQELNRETNTIGSKSSSQDISTAVVQMKVQLEKIREQGLNLE